MDLEEVKAVKKALGGSLNDVVLATVTGAVAGFLEQRRVHVELLRFRVMAPVSVRTREERGTFGNRVSAWMIELALGGREPGRRLVTRREPTRQRQESMSA